ncbi:uncharacterized protein LOC135170063 [Diachasmimorpha longicaudata]|uniref:uncharacterized protein LOC135170063 n=1 Tax=Diachasmimorpha longicaudata TaxID=58733 RepID=UPI0030B8F25B
MGKAKKGNQPTNALKVPPKSIKEGQVKKQKVQKFKQTPAGKVPLVTSNGKANGNSKPQKINKPVVKEPQSPSPKKNQKQNKPAKAAPPQKSPQKKKNAELKKKQKPQDDSDTDEDINEGISIPEDISNLEDDSDDSSEEEEETPNILGESLANSSDEDDEDFEGSDDDDEDEEEEEKVEVKKGVKKFKGSKQISPKAASEDDDDDDEDEDEDDDDEDDDDDEEENFDKSGLSSKNSSLNTSGATNDSDDDDDDDEEDDDDEDDDGPGLKDLLGAALVDHEDDEDFDSEAEDDEDEEDEDMSEDDDNEEPADVKNVSTESSKFIPTEDNPRLSEAEKAEQDTRTIFIGNVPKDLEEKVLRQTFRKFGEIQSLRVRGAIPESPKMKPKVAHITKKYHPLSKTLCVYIVYKSKDSVNKALSFNGQKLAGNYIRVDRIGQAREADPKKSVFLGNVPWDIEDNELWETFSKCGKIDYVRTIRDRHTGCCRGVAYINFADADGATLALDMDCTPIRKREVRVNRYDPNRPKTSAGKGGMKRKNIGKGRTGFSKKPKTEVEKATENSLNAQKRKKQKGSPAQGGGFQGQKAEGKKGGPNKGNKFDKKKKNIAAKLLAPKKFKGSQ